MLYTEDCSVPAEVRSAFDGCDVRCEEMVLIVHSVLDIDAD